MARFDKLEFSPGRDGSQQPDEPKSPERDDEHWMRQADENRRKGQYENALRFYSRALEQDKSLVAGWVGQIQMLIHLKEYRQAETWCRTALGLFPSDAGILAGRAQASCRMKELSRAQELCDGALHQDGQSAYAWMVRGEIMLATKQSTDLHCFDTAQRFDRDWLIPLEIALIYLHYRVPSKALTRVRRAVEDMPESYYAWYVQGLCQERLAFDKQARKSYQRCLELCPRHADADRQLREMQQSPWSFFRMVRRLLPGS
jgi:tetratricopeptide (TPR) repeat protein